MAITNGINLGLMVNGTPGEEHYDELMAFLRGVDSLVMPIVQAIQSAPPATPTNGQLWAIGASATGAWSGQDGKLARWVADGVNAWQFFTPKKGWQAVINTGANGVPILFNGTSWITYAGLPTHADQTAAAALTVGELFKTAAGVLMVKI